MTPYGNSLKLRLVLSVPVRSLQLLALSDRASMCLQMKRGELKIENKRSEAK